jgi:hypothetical protein
MCVKLNSRIECYDDQTHWSITLGIVIKLVRVNSYLFSKLMILTVYIIGQKLRDLAESFAVEGGGLKQWVETRWHTMYDCANSVLRHQIPLEAVNINTLLLFLK